MRILVTNDDGINAPGIDVCARIAREFTDDVWVVGPESDQSGVAHSLSLSDPLRLRQIGPQRFAVKGTPTDCVILAARHLMRDHLPDLVLSGVNRGQNIAEDVSYSGTVAGAIEGTILGIPSIAMSQAHSFANRSNPTYDVAQAHGARVVRMLLEEGIPPGIIMNVNFPDVAPDEVKGIAATFQGRRDQQIMKIDPRYDGRGIPYYWIAFDRSPPETAPGSDLRALAEGRISVTPLRLDMTDEPQMTKLAQAFAKK